MPDALKRSPSPFGERDDDRIIDFICIRGLVEEPVSKITYDRGIGTDRYETRL